MNILPYSMPEWLPNTLRPGHYSMLLSGSIIELLLHNLDWFKYSTDKNHNKFTWYLATQIVLFFPDFNISFFEISAARTKIMEVGGIVFVVIKAFNMHSNINPQKTTRHPRKDVL